MIGEAVPDVRQRKGIPFAEACVAAAQTTAGTEGHLKAIETDLTSSQWAPASLGTSLQAYFPLETLA